MNNVEIKRTYLDENNNPVCTYCEREISDELENYFVNGVRVCCICYVYLHNIDNYTISTITNGFFQVEGIIIFGKKFIRLI